jgi:hypothetical protein
MACCCVAADFCGNSSAGGWVGFDDPRGSNHEQGLSPPLPYGFDYDPKQFPEIAGFKDPAGGVMHVWRDQGWFVNMFQIASHDAAAHSVKFARTEGGWVKGGWQGGRGWQVDASKINSTTENYLLAGLRCPQHAPTHARAHARTHARARARTHARIHAYLSVSQSTLKMR